MYYIVIFYLILSFVTGDSKISIIGNKEQKLHTSVTLKCSIQTENEPLIITWQRKKGSESPENICTYSKTHGAVTQPKFLNKFTLTELNLYNTSINIKNITMDDACCYLCLYNIFGTEKKSAEICITVYIQPMGYLQNMTYKNYSIISCIVTSYPESSVQWILGNFSLKNVTNKIVNKNMTTTVNNSIIVYNENMSGCEVKCQIKFKNNITEYPYVFEHSLVNNVTSKYTSFKDSTYSFIAVFLFLMIVVAFLCIVIYWKRYSAILNNLINI
ncbi:cell surface glycoprotein [Murid herpesvirus 3]|uniref:Cell surface glycoprotein n=2 Tax=Murid betaherpesvirus 3 TaxID=2560603 RepID=A0A1P8VIQ8_9BETA|nr:cell surface glycoprotein [Murine roseolovirus]APZ76228.1 cell surface glycoprotein [Murid betaherpesvirus 3]AYH64771.1 cell surface glycoprotein [Murid herpesvirus 3]